MGEHEKFTLTRVMVDGVEIPVDGLTLQEVQFGEAVDCSSLIFPINNPVEMEIPCRVEPHYPGYHFFMASLGLERLSNNFLKLHGYPMRRGKHRRR